MSDNQSKGWQHKNKKGEMIELFENMRFLDSFRFMGMSLEKLVSFLPTVGFKIIDNHFEEKFAKKQVKLLHQKSFYQYSYFDHFERFSEKRLLPLNKWKNTLAGGEVSITLKNLAHANQVFRTFKCKKLGDYHDFYLTTDTLLLACVFEKFRKVCYETYGLDCAQSFSAANLAGDAYLKTCNINVRLLEERDILIWQKILCAVACPQFTRVDFSKLTTNICRILIKQLRVPSVSQSTQIISMGA